MENCKDIIDNRTDKVKIEITDHHEAHPAKTKDQLKVLLKNYILTLRVSSCDSRRVCRQITYMQCSYLTH